MTIMVRESSRNDICHSVAVTANTLTSLVSFSLYTGFRFRGCGGSTLVSGCFFLRWSRRVSSRLKTLSHLLQGYFGPVPGQWCRLLFLLRFLVPFVASTLPHTPHFQLSATGSRAEAGVDEDVDEVASHGSFGDELLGWTGFSKAPNGLNRWFRGLNRFKLTLS